MDTSFNVKPKISIIIIYTNDSQIAESKKWIEKQSVSKDIEQIILDNRQNKNYTSASSALNDGAEKSNGEYLIFMHQDIYLWDEKVIENAVEFLEKNEGDIILGAAGVREDGQACFDIFIGKNKRKWAWGTEGKPVKAITLDECFLMMRKSTWEKYKFDECILDDWHFYGADICYTNTLNNGTNYIFPMAVCHDSFGNLTCKGFKKSAYKMVEKYCGKIDRIITTCINAKCSKAGVRRYFFMFKIKMIIKNCIKAIVRVFGLSKLAEKINKKRKAKKGLFAGE